MELTTLLIVSAVFIGIIIGIALQRGRGCTNTAFRNLLLIGNGELALMLVVIVTIETIGYYFLSNLPGFNFFYNPISLSYILIPLGGFLFGLGTVFAGGCAGGTCYRVGEGKITSVLAFVGFGVGIGVIAVGPLSQPIIDLRQKTLLTINGETPSLAHFLPQWVWVMSSFLILLITIYYYYQKKQQGKLKLEHLKPYWNPITTGFVIGIFGIIARYSSTLAGRSFGLSTTDGIGQLVLGLVDFIPLGWAGYFILGLIGGAAISALSGKEIEVSIPTKIQVVRYFGGGILLGIGAMIGQGCNFGHIFGGIPELGISSFISVIFMILGNWTASKLYYVQLEQPIPSSTPID